MWRAFFGVFVLMFVSGPLAAEMKAEIAGGVEVGEKIPHMLVLEDQTGSERSFDELKGDNGIALFFVRSVDWCPYCQMQMIDLNARAGEFEAVGFTPVAVSYDSVEKQAKFAKKRDIEFTLLSDPESASIDAFGIRNERYEAGSKGYGVPHPVIYLVDGDGVIRARFAEEGYKARPELDDVLEAARALEDAKGAAGD